MANALKSIAHPLCDVCELPLPPSRGAMRDVFTSERESTFDRHIETFKLKTGDDSIVGLAAVISGENGVYKLPVSIFLELIEHRFELERKNGNLKSLVSHYVTSEVV